MDISEQQLKTAFLRQRQSLPLTALVQMSLRRIRLWYEYWDGNVYVSLGGKDSHALLHLVRTIYPEVPGAFVDTGLEYPEVRALNAKTPNVIFLKPDMPFNKVIEKYGWPVISKKMAQYISEIQRPTERNKNTVRLRTTGYRADGTHSPMSKISDKWLYLKDAPFKISHKCCKVMKVNPLRKFAAKTGSAPFIGTTSDESGAREHNYIRYGCNAYGNNNPVSSPIIFWTEQHVLQYLRENNIEVASCYGKQEESGGGLWRFSGVQRTGCMFCTFGAHLEQSPNRFVMMERTHPEIHNYCMNKLGLKNVLNYIGVPYREEQPSFIF